MKCDADNRVCEHGCTFVAENTKLQAGLPASQIFLNPKQAADASD